MFEVAKGDDFHQGKLVQAERALSPEALGFRLSQCVSLMI